jgi:hypothetical protein
MDKLLFVHREIKHVLEILDYLSDDDRRKLMAVIANLTYDELVKILKTLYKVETEYLEFKLSDTKNTEEFLNKFKPAHE